MSILEDSKRTILTVPIRNELYHYHKYEDEINTLIQKFMEKVSNSVPLVNKNKVKEIFWKIANGNDPDPEDPYLFLTLSFAHRINQEILIKLGKIQPFHIQLQDVWRKYLVLNFINPITLKIPLAILRNLAFAVPFSKEVLTTYGIVTETISADDLKKMEENDSINLYQFWMHFEREFKHFYLLFEKTCLYLGEEFSRITGDSCNNLDSMFGLSYDGVTKKNNRTPIGDGYDDINKIVIELKHIKNCVVSHGRFQFDDYQNPTHVTINDMYRDKINFSKTYNKHELHSLHYILHMLLDGIKRVALETIFSLSKK